MFDLFFVVTGPFLAEMPRATTNLLLAEKPLVTTNPFLAVKPPVTANSLLAEKPPVTANLLLSEKPPVTANPVLNFYHAKKQEVESKFVSFLSFLSFNHIKISAPFGCLFDQNNGIEVAVNQKVERTEFESDVSTYELMSKEEIESKFMSCLFLFLSFNHSRISSPFCFFYLIKTMDSVFESRHKEHRVL